MDWSNCGSVLGGLHGIADAICSLVPRPRSRPGNEAMLDVE